MSITIGGVFFTVKDVDKSIEFYKKLLDIEPYAIEKYIDKDISRWAEFGLADGMHFGLINESAMGKERKLGNNSVLNLYTDNLQEAYEKVKHLGFNVLCEPSNVEDSPYSYECFIMEDLDGNLIEIAHM